MAERSERGRRLLSQLAPILWIGVIFGFSLSSDPGGDLPEWLTVIASPVAHFLEFFVLGVLLFIGRSEGSDRQRFFIAGMAIAIADEWLQSFVPGRVTDVLDVVVDGFGLWVGILLAPRVLRLRALLNYGVFVAFFLSALRVFFG